MTLLMETTLMCVGLVIIDFKSRDRGSVIAEETEEHNRTKNK